MQTKLISLNPVSSHSSSLCFFFSVSKFRTTSTVLVYVLYKYQVIYSRSLHSLSPARGRVFRLRNLANCRPALIKLQDSEVINFSSTFFRLKQPLSYMVPWVLFTNLDALSTLFVLLSCG
jgi:hypothetical protein